MSTTRLILILLLFAWARPLPAQSNDVAKRFEEIQARAAKGEAEAQCQLGGCYRTGEGVATNAVEAVKWYRQAAAQDYAQAQNALGNCYSMGPGRGQERGGSRQVVSPGRGDKGSPKPKTTSGPAICRARAWPRTARKR